MNKIAYLLRYYEWDFQRTIGVFLSKEAAEKEMADREDGYNGWGRYEIIEVPLLGEKNDY